MSVGVRIRIENGGFDFALRRSSEKYCVSGDCWVGDSDVPFHSRGADKEAARIMEQLVEQTWNRIWQNRVKNRISTRS